MRRKGGDGIKSGPYCISSRRWCDLPDGDTGVVAKQDLKQDAGFLDYATSLWRNQRVLPELLGGAVRSEI
jgi:hypothetical protein